jgi:hypothetical protein
MHASMCACLMTCTCPMGMCAAAEPRVRAPRRALLCGVCARRPGSGQAQMKGAYGLACMRGVWPMTCMPGAHARPVARRQLRRARMSPVTDQEACASEPPVMMRRYTLSAPGSGRLLLLPQCATDLLGRPCLLLHVAPASAVAASIHGPRCLGATGAPKLLHLLCVCCCCCCCCCSMRRAQCTPSMRFCAQPGTHIPFD